jgi:aminopeptidase N
VLRSVAAILVALALASGETASAQGGIGEPDAAVLSHLSTGVSRVLAVERAGRVSNVRYDMALSVPAERKAPVAGRVTIAFDLTGPSSFLPLDFEPDSTGRLKRVEVNGRTLPPRIDSGHIVLPASLLRDGGNDVVIEFDAGDAPLNRSDDFLYTIFVPARAHEAFPCFDQPDLKARWTLALDVPHGWQTVANGAEASSRADAGRTRVSFAETPPISTYLFAFAAGKFTVEQAERNGRTFRLFHRETDAAKVARNVNALFDLHAAALAWMERYTGIPYPFDKFDFVLIPAFQFGGMEHPGAVFYNASSLMLDESATQNQRLERASTIAHETSHMWFGDLVTMTWFTDVWMKEVFANFMAAKIVNPSFPDVNHALRFLHTYYPAAYEVDRTAGSNAIRQPLDNLEDAGTLYGNIIYDKAPIVMRQLETLMGPDTLRDGLRVYLERYRFGNASWPDLIAILDPLAGEDLAAWSHAWVDEPGRIVVRTELTRTDGRIEQLAFTQHDPDRGRGLTWTEDLQVSLGYADRIETIPVRLAAERTDVDRAAGREAPLFVLPNGGGIGYGEFHLDGASLRWLAANLPSIDDPLTRGSAWVTLWDAVLDNELSPVRFVDLALTALRRETDELNVQRILAYLQHAYWTFLPEAARTARASRIEQTLREALDAAPTESLKGAYFRTLRDVAQTPPTLGWLTSVWRGDETVPGLTLAENDFIALAQELAVRQVPGWAALLDAQVERTKNPDRKARLRFILPALSADLTERDRFFASLADPANRRHEAWVLEGVAYLNHPLRAAAATSYIQPALALLHEIQQTGDIFFPKRWVDSVLGGHRSFEAARIVNLFLLRAPDDYPDRLRRIILSSADDLFRASGLR